MSTEFDDFDDLALGNALRRMTGAAPDADAALGTFHKRVRVARIRRISVAASSGAAVVLIAGGAFALSSRNSNSPVKPADRGGVLDTIVDTVVDPGLPGTPTSSTAPSGGDGDNGTSSGGPAGGSNNNPSGSPSDSGSSGSGDDSGHGGGSGPTGSTLPGSTTTTIDDHDDGSDDESGSSSGGSGSTSSTTIELVTKRCSSIGGAFTANRSAGNSITNVSPAAGFYKSQQEIEDEKITVVFRNSEVEYHVIATWTGSSFACSVES